MIFLIADDLGYGDLGCYGAKNVSTPHSDLAASEGIRFTGCHAAASTSTPQPLLHPYGTVCPGARPAPESFRATKP
ncbi:MAG: sulfatase-like hydrolase/transferase [Pseudoflavonifractor sp.]|nr:sulfatase-like hydrolase/transferase [Alloprevotella sp.]MCM1117340.1 sulfatase-like hydrolase/transferase [Pseudoflavonifractor sp.]